MRDRVKRPRSDHTDISETQPVSLKHLLSVLPAIQLALGVSVRPGTARRLGALREVNGVSATNPSSTAILLVVLGDGVIILPLGSSSSTLTLLGDRDNLTPCPLATPLFLQVVEGQQLQEYGFLVLIVNRVPSVRVRSEFG